MWISAGVFHVAPATAASTETSDMTYQFQDEFNGPPGSSPDPNKWYWDVGRGGWGNHELQTYTKSRASSFLDGNGNLVIRATKDWRGRYFSARMHNAAHPKFRGTWEARIKLNVQPGVWPAWWTMGVDVEWPQSGEVDMLENYGGSIFETSVHTPDDSGTGALTKSLTLPADSNWHVWRMVWTAEGLQFSRDGVTYFTVVPFDLKHWVYDGGVPMFTLLNLAVGGAGGSPPSSVRFPVDMLVDYVRVW